MFFWSSCVGMMEHLFAPSPRFEKCLSLEDQQFICPPGKSNQILLTKFRLFSKIPASQIFLGNYDCSIVC